MCQFFEAENQKGHARKWKGVQGPEGAAMQWNARKCKGLRGDFSEESRLKRERSAERLKQIKRCAVAFYDTSDKEKNSSKTWKKHVARRAIEKVHQDWRYISPPSYCKIISSVMPPLSHLMLLLKLLFLLLLMQTDAVTDANDDVMMWPMLCYSHGIATLWSRLKSFIDIVRDKTRFGNPIVAEHSSLSGISLHG